jgi:hypothetical protein
MPVIEFAQIKWRPGTPDGLTRSEVRGLGLIEIEPNIAPLATLKRHWSLNLLGAVALSGAVWFAVGVGLAGCATSPASDLYDGQRHAPAQVKAFCADIGGTYVHGAGCAISYAHGAKSLNPQLQNGVCRIIVEQSQIRRAAAEAALRAACNR